MPYYESSKRPPQGAYRKLRFISDLVGLKGLTYDAVATMLGLSRPSVYAAIREDDMPLSRAFAICDALDCGLEFILSKDPEKDGLAGQVLDASLMVHTPEGFKLKRLAFLSLTLSRYGISRGELAERMGLSPTTVSTWFQKDDIKLSRLFQIVDALGLSIRINIVSREEPPAAADGRYYVVHISQTCATPL